MPLIQEEDRKFILDYFSKELVDPVKIVYFTQHQSPLVVPSNTCMYCKETGELLEEVSSLSDKIELEVRDFLKDEVLARQYGVEKIPAVVITGRNKGKIRFFGIPSGYEFSSLIEVIKDVSKGGSDLSAATKEAIGKVSSPVHIQVFVTPT
ncbi:MAG TPA: thioredoxin family protein [Chloroflexota bacterium]